MHGRRVRLSEGLQAAAADQRVAAAAMLAGELLRLRKHCLQCDARRGRAVALLVLPRCRILGRLWVRHRPRPFDYLPARASAKQGGSGGGLLGLECTCADNAGRKSGGSRNARKHRSISTMGRAAIRCGHGGLCAGCCGRAGPGTRASPPPPPPRGIPCDCTRPIKVGAATYCTFRGAPGPHVVAACRQVTP
jgi:hypothetical protein